MLAPISLIELLFVTILLRSVPLASKNPEEAFVHPERKLARASSLRVTGSLREGE